MRKLEIFFGVLKIPVDFLATMTAFWIARVLRASPEFLPWLQSPAEIIPEFNEYMKFTSEASAILILLFAINQLYSLKETEKISAEIVRVASTTIAWVTLIIVYFFAIRELFFSRLVLFYGAILTIFLIIFGRLGIRFFQQIIFHAGFARRRLLIIGTDFLSNEAFKIFQKDPRYEVVGILSPNNLHNNSKEKLNIIGTLDQFDQIIKKYNVQEVIQAQADLPPNKSAEILNFCQEQSLRYSFIPNLLEVQRTNISFSTINGLPIIELKPTPLDGWGRVYKRCIDIIGSSIGIIILGPLMLLIALIIKLDSRGTIFFSRLDDGSRVKRVGREGKLFNFLKFRTMHPGTHNLRYTELSKLNTRKGTPMVKIKNDPRVTRFGKFLRRTSLDELPQLFNVLTGDMSLTGPRAHLPEEVAQYKSYHRRLLTIKPGITGLPQISGRSGLNFEEEVRLDTFYIENWSPWLDFKIIFKTIGVVLQGKNAE